MKHKNDMKWFVFIKKNSWTDSKLIWSECDCVVVYQMNYLHECVITINTQSHQALTWWSSWMSRFKFSKGFALTFNPIYLPWIFGVQVDFVNWFFVFCVNTKHYIIIGNFDLLSSLLFWNKFSNCQTKNFFKVKVNNFDKQNFWQNYI